jgi:uncharacterized sulfatase
VPFIVRFPEQFRRAGRDAPGTTCDDLVSFVDLGPTFLNLAGISIPTNMQGQPVMGASTPAAREYTFSARDRIDERYDIIRSARDKRYRYVRNFMPWLPLYQYLQSPEALPLMKELRKLHEAGTLHAEAEHFFAKTRSREELYDTQTDPHEVKNLADSADHRAVLLRMRKAVTDWMLDIRDIGFLPECEYKELIAQYGSEWGIVHQGADNPVAKWLQFVLLTEEGEKSLSDMIAGLDNSDRVIRYWAALGLGNLGSKAVSAESKLAEKLNDPAPSVQIAAARALFFMGKRKTEALNLLNGKLSDANAWVQLLAANVLDSLGSEGQAKLGPAQNGANKYVKRIYDHRGKTEFGFPPFDIPPLVDASTSPQRIRAHRRQQKQSLHYSVHGNALRITINDHSVRKIDIINMNGRIILSRSVNGNGTLRISRKKLNKGFYVIRLYRQSGVENIKISL